MTLKLKLLLGFCAVLLLTVVVGIWGVRGMDSMETVNAQADTIITGATHLQTAQSEQLRYFLYSTDKSVASVRESLAASRKSFDDVQAMLASSDPARSELNTLAGQVDTVLKSFNELLVHTAALVKVDDDYTVQGRKVLASTNELIEFGYQRQNESLDQASTALVLQLTDARA